MPSQPSAAQRLRAAAHPGRQDFRQHGGRVSGPGTATSDSIPAQLSNGEFVLPADTVKAVGVKRLRALIKDTHQPSPGPKRRNHLADGDMPEDEIQQPGMRLKPSAVPSPSNTFPGNRLPGNSGVSSAQPPATASTPPASGMAETKRTDALAQIPSGGYPAAPKADGSQDSWRNTDLGRNISNTLNALPGIGGIGRVAATGGALSKGINAGSETVDAASRLLVAGGGLLSGGGATAAAAAPITSAPPI
ncbi:MAG: hypothetical protein RR100_24200, partial [Comamonas sp.]